MSALRAYRWMKRGFLPVEGGHVAQSRTFIEAVEWIERIQAFHDRSHET